MKRFTYKNSDIIENSPFNKKSVPLPSQMPNAQKWNLQEWDSGLTHRTTYFRQNAFKTKKNTFLDMNYSNSNLGKGFHKHEKGNSYKYRFTKIKDETEGKLKELDLIKEEQREEGGDVMGYARLSIGKAKDIQRFRRKPYHTGDNHGKGYFGSGLRKYMYMEEINRLNNNKNNYLEQEDNEFNSIQEGIKREKLELSNQNPNSFPTATDGI